MVDNPRSGPEAQFKAYLAEGRFMIQREPLYRPIRVLSSRRCARTAGRRISNGFRPPATEQSIRSR